MTRFTDILRKAAPTLTAAILFFVVSAVCYAPQFEGRVLPQHDIQQFDGMSRDIRECRTDYGEDPQWTGAMFGGMPAYLINIRYPAQIVKHTADKVLGIVNTPAGFIFFAMFAAWLMIAMMGISPWIGLVTGLAYGLSTYFFLIIGAGHVTKMWALVFAPAMMGAIFMTLRGRRKWLGGTLTALFASLEIGANHPQIAFYFVLAAAALWISDLVFAIRERHLPDFAKRTGILAAAALLALGSNFAPLWYTAQHTDSTIRGGSEVADDAAASHGLDLQYATAWSYGIGESWNMLIPDFAGGDSAATFSSNGAVAESLKDLGLSSLATQIPTYWGAQPYTAGPTYLGAVAIFLALLGALLADDRNRWWILASSLLALLLAWGHNFMWFTELCFKYLPLYNKFRTVSMALVVLEWSVPLLAGIGVWKLWRYAAGERTAEERRRMLRATGIAAGIVGGIALIFALFGGSMFDFDREASGEMMSEQFLYMLQQSPGGEEYIRKGVHDELGWSVADAMAQERGEILSRDAWRSFGLVAVAAGSVLLFVLGRIRRTWLAAMLACWIMLDMIPVDLRYSPYDRFVAPRKAQIAPTAADREIMADKSLGYRVLNLSVSPFNDATTSMFHRSVGGYHGAKLGRYQDIIDYYLNRDDSGVLDMLDTKYVITRNGEVIERPSANGAAWFVENTVPAESAKRELEMLGETDLKTTAVVSAESIPSVGTALGTGEIELTEYRPNYLKYEYTADGEAVAVFSEIYYPDGWTMYVDGAEAPCFRADYILRAALLPAGRHTVEWRFRAPMWGVSEGITLVCSLLIFIALITTIIYYGKKQR